MLIYALVDVRSWETFYVGCTGQDPRARLQQHVLEPARPEIKALFAEREMGLEILEVVEDQSCARSREAFWIERAMDRDEPLVNHHYVKRTSEPLW